MEEYYDAKRRLFVEPDPDGRRPPAAVNVGDPSRPPARRGAEGARGTAADLRPGDDAEVRPETLELTPDGARFSVGGLALETRLRGRFNVENILGAVAGARLAGVADDAIAPGVAHLAGVPGRLELVDEGQPFAVVVDYAHKPDALENVLVEARSLGEGRLVCVFGCGGDRDRGKRPLMGEIAARLADAVIVTSDNPRSEDPLAIIDEILAGAGEDVEVEPDRALAIRRAIELARARATSSSSPARATS